MRILNIILAAGTIICGIILFYLPAPKSVDFGPYKPLNTIGTYARVWVDVTNYDEIALRKYAEERADAEIYMVCPVVLQYKDKKRYLKVKDIQKIVDENPGIMEIGSSTSGLSWLIDYQFKETWRSN